MVIRMRVFIFAVITIFSYDSLRAMEETVSCDGVFCYHYKNAQGQEYYYYVYPLSEHQTHNNVLGEDAACLLCEDTFNESVCKQELLCNHNFCLLCLVKWYAHYDDDERGWKDKYTKCPTCAEQFHTTLKEKLHKHPSYWQLRQALRPHLAVLDSQENSTKKNGVQEISKTYNLRITQDEAQQKLIERVATSLFDDEEDDEDF